MRHSIIHRQLMPGEVSLPDQAEIHRLTQDEDSDVREEAAEALGDAFRHVPDKALAWQDLIKLTQDKDDYVPTEPMAKRINNRPTCYLLGEIMGKITSETTRKATFLAEANRDMDYSETKITDGHKSAFGYGYDKDMAKANENSQKEASREWNKKK